MHLFFSLFTIIAISGIFSKPLTIKVNKPRVSQGQKSLFDVLKQSLENTNDRQIKDHTAIRKLRDSASQSIKVI